MADHIQVIITWINSLKIDPEYLKPANLLLIILILVTGGVKVKREKGEGRAQGVQGFVGVKKKKNKR